MTDETKVTPYDLSRVKQDVEFLLYTRALQNPVTITEETWDSCKQYFLMDAEVKFVTHGWNSSGSAEVCTSIRDAYLKQRDINVIIVNWEKIADLALYPISMESTRGIGKYYGSFVSFLVDKGVKLSNIHLIGHSLGAQMSGFAGRAVTQGKIARVTGLDAALPGFLLDHIKSTDAEFVDLIHTCAGILGMVEPVGDADFYPNGGTSPQPGSSLLSAPDEDGVVIGSHSRSWELYAASIYPENKFLSLACKTWVGYLLSANKKGDTLMGDPTPTTARGTYFLQTSGKSPYTLG